MLIPSSFKSALSAVEASGWPSALESLPPGGSLDADSEERLWVAVGKKCGSECDEELDVLMLEWAA